MRRELVLRLAVDGDTLTGAVVDEHGRVRAFGGWVGLLAALDATLGSGLEEGADATAAPADPLVEG